MTEWGPWDHQSPLVRALSTKGPEHVYALHALANPAIIPSDDAVTARLDLESKPPTLHVVAKKRGVTPYSLTVMHDPAGAAISFPISGTTRQPRSGRSTCSRRPRVPMRIPTLGSPTRRRSVRSSSSTRSTSSSGWTARRAPSRPPTSAAIPSA